MALRALVVGGTGGIGYAMAQRIATEAKPGSTITISGRTKPENIPHANIQFRQLDASSMRAIKQYADQFKASASADEKLDLLIMSQGILTMAGRTETEEGIDRKMALHYYGRQLLFRELEPVLKEDAKVIIVLDGSKGSPDKLNWDDLDLKTSYSLGAAADHCVSMIDAMGQHYAAQQSAVGSGRRHFLHTSPGIVRTNIGQNLPWYVRPLAAGLATALGITPEECAEHMVRGSEEVAAAAQKEGRFFGYVDRKGKAIPNKHTWTEEQRNKVAGHTWKIVDDALKVVD